MKTIVFMVFALWAGTAHAGEYRLLDVDRLDFEASRIVPQARDPYVPEYSGRWREQAALVWDLTWLQWGYWNNRVHTETTNPSGRVTTVGWQFEVGVRVTDYFDVYRMHHSRHVMEQAPEPRFVDGRQQFPVEDLYGVRFHIVRGKS